MSNHRKPQRQSANSVDSRVKAENQLVQPPSGIVIDSEAMWTVWRQYTALRADSDWTDIDLLMIYKLCKWELEVGELTRQIDIEGMVIDGKENQRVKVRTTLTSQILSMTRAMGLMQRASEPRTMNKHGQRRVTERPKAEISLLAGSGGWE